MTAARTVVSTVDGVIVIPGAALPHALLLRAVRRRGNAYVLRLAGATSPRRPDTAAW